MTWDEWDGLKDFTFNMTYYGTIELINDTLKFIEDELKRPYRLDYQNTNGGGWGLMITVRMSYDDYLTLEDTVYGAMMGGSCMDCYKVDCDNCAYKECDPEYCENCDYSPFVDIDTEGGQ